MQVEAEALLQHVDATLGGDLHPGLGGVHFVDAHRAIERRRPARERDLIKRRSRGSQITGLEVDVGRLDGNTDRRPIMVVEAEREDAGQRRRTGADLHLGVLQRELSAAGRPADLGDAGDDGEAVVLDPEVHTGHVDVKCPAFDLARLAIETDIDRQLPGADYACDAVWVVDERHERGKIDIGHVGRKAHRAVGIDLARHLALHRLAGELGREVSRNLGAVDLRGDLQRDVGEGAEHTIDGVVHIHHAVADSKPGEPPLLRLRDDVPEALFARFEVGDQPVIVGPKPRRLAVRHGPVHRQAAGRNADRREQHPRPPAP